MSKSVFDFEGEERVYSPEQLNDYIRVARPGVWALFAALAVAFAGLLFWGFTGRICAKNQPKKTDKNQPCRGMANKRGRKQAKPL